MSEFMWSALTALITAMVITVMHDQDADGIHIEMYNLKAACELKLLRSEYCIMDLKFVPDAKGGEG